MDMFRGGRLQAVWRGRAGKEWRVRTGRHVDGSIVVEGRERAFHLFVPSSLNERVPLLIALHGGGGAGLWFEKLTTREQFDELATRDQWIVAYPDGLYHRWNDGRNDATAHPSAERVDDVLFISTLIDHLKELYSIDATRVFATGMSNGGMMTERLGCELSDKIAAIAAVAGSLPQALADATPARPTPVLIMHGTEDPIVPWIGGEVQAFGEERGRVLSVPDTARFWARHNSCTEVIPTTYLPAEDGGTSHTWKEECTNPATGLKVVLYGIDGGGHVWPGGAVLPRNAPARSTPGIDACTTIWEFFRERRPSNSAVQERFLPK